MAAVIVVAGAGFWVWHETPGFCGAICHTPMDAYYETYAEGDADKRGNALEGAASMSMMSYVHGLTGSGCLDCHEPTLSQQIGEGVAWVTGGYAVEGAAEDGTAWMEARTVDELTAATGKAGYEMRLNDACHADVTLETLADATADLGSVERNPHSTQHDAIPVCSDCHRAHEQSVNACTQCHSDSPVPAGWLTVSQANQLRG